MCGPNVDLIQLFCSSERRSGVQGSVMQYLLWLRSSVARLPPRATVLADTYLCYSVIVPTGFGRSWPGISPVPVKCPIRPNIWPWEDRIYLTGWSNSQ